MDDQMSTPPKGDKADARAETDNEVRMPTAERMHPPEATPARAQMAAQGPDAGPGQWNALHDNTKYKDMFANIVTAGERRHPHMRPKNLEEADLRNLEWQEGAAARQTAAAATKNRAAAAHRAGARPAAAPSWDGRDAPVTRHQPARRGEAARHED